MGNLSYVAGSSDVPLKYETIGREFDATAHRCAAREALIVPAQQIRWRYAQLKERVDLLAAGLLALGLNPGDRLGIWAPNCAEFPLTVTGKVQKFEMRAQMIRELGVAEQNTA